MRGKLRWTAVLMGGIWAAACSRAHESSEVAASARPITVLDGFQDQVVFGGITLPTAVRFARDGRVFIAEKSGLVKVFDPRIDTSPRVFADLRTQVHNYWDRGLVDLELHPDFPDTPYLYVLYTHDAELGGEAPRWGAIDATSDRCPTPPGPTTDGCIVSGRLSRLEADADGTLRGLEEVLVENWPNQFPSHSVAALTFGPDGMLYVSAGDGASFDFADYGQAGDPPNPLGDAPVPLGRPQTPPDARGGALRAQNTTLAPVRFNGKIIRVDPTTGRAAPGNPLEGSAVPDAASVIASGLRNPFRMTFRPGTRELWIGDVGWGRWEEIDRLVDPVGAVVENFGWPCFEGAARQASYEAANLTACNELYASGQHVAPYYAYSHGSAVLDGDGCGDAQASITGLAFYADGLYPPEYRGALFFADYARNCIWAMFPGADGLPDPDSRHVFVSAAPQPLQLLIGPGSDLYYLSLNGELHRVAALGTNQPPVAQLTAATTDGAVPLTATFDGSASSDPDPGDSLTFAWDLDGDGAYDDAQSPSASYVYSSAGERTVRLRVTDSRGAIATASVVVSAGEPEAGLLASIDAAEPTAFTVGDTVQFAGGGSDGPLALPAANLRWDLVVQHCPSEDACHPHLVQSFEGVEAGSFVAPEHDYPYHLELILRVSTEDGREATAVARLDPITVDLTLQSDPPGLPLALNDAVNTAPFTAEVVAGSRNTISAPEHPGYRFLDWSNGGERAQLLSATADTLVSARYAIETTPAPLEQLGSIIARVMAPAGTGSPTLEVIRDDDFPAPGTNDPRRQYDSWTFDVAPKDDWIGYEFAEQFVFGQVVFQEGLNFSDGGWFEGFEVRVRRDGVWTPITDATVTPVYPGTSDRVGYRTYRIGFGAVAGDAIQLYGPAGGSSHFISVGELDVSGWRAADSGDVLPFANIAPPPAVVVARESVVLDARASFDPSGEPLSYRWTQTAGPAATIVDPGASQLEFVAPDVSVRTALEFSLTVGAGSRTSAPVAVTVEISPLSATTDVSLRGRILISEPAPVGSGSRDLEILRDGITPPPGSREPWSQFDTYVADPTVIEGWVGYEFSSPQRIGQVVFQEGGEFFDGGWFSALSVEVRRDGRWFSAPNLVAAPEYPNEADGVGFETYTFSSTPTLADAVRLIGQPGGAARFFSVAELRVFVQPPPSGGAAPIAAAGVDFTAAAAAPTSLDGSASLDPDASPLRYAWTQVAGARVELSDPTSATPSFVIPRAYRRQSTLTFSLTVSDEAASSSADQVVVRVVPATPRDLTVDGSIIASTRASSSGQSADLEVIRDGVMPSLTATDPRLEFDTWTGELTGEGWIGYQFASGHTFTQLLFQEGLHFSDGGWFTSLGVQVRRSGVWRDVRGLQSAPPYPGVDDGQGFQTYTLTFEPTVGDAIRIVGFPGGYWRFFTVAELRVQGY